ncbi:hypothetical protein K443DRAFT_678376 [Laccaria amethystina LaAM-08-1]|uniref:Unplaced genomic scaffold K443scaffold_72, whole genome shotgun sequence n=1 Tax=Laccaria amethystina LaAM-08-1 TaxID=1095629 RepID=A0A0C9WRU7_9AGAR|nr:hypothetical protein K443DRAFT_678376 [Laccaria amethystina LaAM-08-1]
MNDGDATSPLALSFPAILRNPGLAHLSQVKKRQLQQRDQNEGKRWLRRKDNARFAGNPHVIAATKTDFVLHPQQARATFPEPLPSFLPRTAKVPAITPPTTDPASANAGRFSLSMKGMRKELRRSGGRAEALVRDIETEMVEWLRQGGTLLAPSRGAGSQLVNDDMHGTPVGETGSITEVSRTPLQLIWRISDDAFARYVVHCCARYHEVVSFSKGDSDQRLTYLLRPNVRRPDYHAAVILDTPPVTDVDYSSNPDLDTDDNIDSDCITDRELESDVDVAEPTLPAMVASPHIGSSDDSWSLVDDADIEGVEVESQLEALSLSPSSPLQPPTQELEPTDVASPRRAHPFSLYRPHPLRVSRRAARSASSPSRSPARAPARWKSQTKRHVDLAGGRVSFYHYLFS